MVEGDKRIHAAALRRSVLLTISTVARAIAQSISAAVYSLMAVLRMVRCGQHAIQYPAALCCDAYGYRCSVKPLHTAPSSESRAGLHHRANLLLARLRVCEI